MVLKLSLVVATITLSLAQPENTWPDTTGLWVGVEKPGGRCPTVCLVHQPKLGFAFVGYYKDIRARRLRACDLAVGFDLCEKLLVVQWVEDVWYPEGGIGQQTRVRTLGLSDLVALTKWKWGGQR